jgi:hypothetical protein
MSATETYLLTLLLIVIGSTALGFLLGHQVGHITGRAQSVIDVDKDLKSSFGK